MTDPKTLTNERKSQHGDWMQQSYLSNALKTTMRSRAGWHHLTAFQQEALDMIQTKISRILSGDPNHADHWDDIAGYAFLGKGGHEQSSLDMQKKAREELERRANNAPIYRDEKVPTIEEELNRMILPPGME